MPVETIMDDAVSVTPAAAGGLSHESERQIITDAGFYWREHSGVKVLVCKPLEDAGFVNGFSTRLGGVSPFEPSGDALNLAGFDEDSAENIYENRRRFLRAFDGDYKLATVWQVHGADVKIVRSDADVTNSEERCDALTSDLANTLVAVKTADCVPVLIGDPTSRSFAAVHAGWKGTAAAIVRRAVETLQAEYDADPANIIAAIGPCASGENYEIGQDVKDAFEKNVPDHDKYFTPTRPGHAFVDLKAANRDWLTQSGIEAANVYISTFCTIARSDVFFSYRVEKKLYGKTGRLLSAIGRRS